MAYAEEMLNLVDVLKAVVDFVSDDKKVQKFYADVGGIQKVADDLKAAQDAKAAALRALNDAKDLQADTGAKLAEVARREGALLDAEAQLDSDEKAMAKDKLELAAKLQAVIRDSAVASKARDSAEDAQTKAEKLLADNQVKADELEVMKAKYISRLATASSLTE